MPIFRNFHLACVAWKYKWAQERTGRARDTRRLIFTEYETILHHTTNHDILPCKNSEQFQDSRKASNRVHMMILMKEINVDSVAVGGREEFFMTIILHHHDEDDSSSVTVMTVTI